MNEDFEEIKITSSGDDRDNYEEIIILKNERGRKLSIFEYLPTEMLDKILEELLLNDKINFMQVSRYIFNFIKNKNDNIPLKEIQILLAQYYPDYMHYYENDRLYYFLENCPNYSDIKTQLLQLYGENEHAHGTYTHFTQKILPEHPLFYAEGKELYEQYRKITDDFILDYPELVELLKNYSHRKYTDEKKINPKKDELREFILKEELHLFPKDPAITMMRFCLLIFLILTSVMIYGFT